MMADRSSGNIVLHMLQTEQYSTGTVPHTVCTNKKVKAILLFLFSSCLINVATTCAPVQHYLVPQDFQVIHNFDVIKSIVP